MYNVHILTVEENCAHTHKKRDQSPYLPFHELFNSLLTSSGAVRDVRTTVPNEPHNESKDFFYLETILEYFLVFFPQQMIRCKN